MNTSIFARVFVGEPGKHLAKTWLFPSGNHSKTTGHGPEHQVSTRQKPGVSPGESLVECRCNNWKNSWAPGKRQAKAWRLPGILLVSGRNPGNMRKPKILCFDSVLDYLRYSKNSWVAHQLGCANWGVGCARNLTGNLL